MLVLSWMMPPHFLTAVLAIEGSIAARRAKSKRAGDEMNRVSSAHLEAFRRKAGLRRLERKDAWISKRRVAMIFSPRRRGSLALSLKVRA